MAEVARVVVLGAGGHARVVADALGTVAGHVSPAPGTDDLLGEWLGDDGAVRALAAAGHRFALGVGFVDRLGAARRADLLERCAEVELVVVVHPQAIVAASVRLDPGVFVAAGSVLNTGVCIGRGAIVNTGAVVDHDCDIGANVHVAPGVAMSGDVVVGAGALVGVGATVRQGVRIGADAVIGAGAAVVTDVAEGATVLGVPAREVTT